MDGRNTLLYRNWDEIRKELVGYPGSRVELYFLRQSTSRRGESQARRARPAPPTRHLNPRQTPNQPKAPQQPCLPKRQPCSESRAQS